MNKVLEDILLTFGAFFVQGMRTGIAILIGAFVMMFFKRHPKGNEPIGQQEITINLLLQFFLIGSVVLSIFYGLVDTSSLVSEYDDW